MISMSAFQDHFLSFPVIEWIVTNTAFSIFIDSRIASEHIVWGIPVPFVQCFILQLFCPLLSPLIDIGIMLVEVNQEFTFQFLEWITQQQTCDGPKYGDRNGYHFENVAYGGNEENNREYGDGPRHTNDPGNDAHCDIFTHC